MENEPLRVGASVFVDGNKFYRWRGDTAFRRDENLNHVDCFDLVSQEWTVHPTVGTAEPSPQENIPSSVTGSGVALAKGKLYLFGGFSSIASGQSRYFRDLFVLDMATFQWKKLTPINDHEGPIQKYICGMSPLDGTTVLIFGGFGLKCEGLTLQPWSQYHWSDEFQAMWTNELHLYNFMTNEWSSPEIRGIKPSPCAAFCFTMIDQTRFILFGGRQRPSRVNEIQILNTSRWEWSGPILPSADQLWPEPRSLHTGVCLLDPDSIKPPNSSSVTESSFKEQELLVLWGQDKDSIPLVDAWFFKVTSLQWEKLHLPLKGRKWHSTAVSYPSFSESMVVTIGGFSKDEAMWICPNHNDTIIMKFGIPSLYKLCVQYLCNFTRPEVLETIMSQYLPIRVAQRINEITLQQADFTSVYRPYSYFDYLAKASDV